MYVYCVFFFKQKTAYEMRISDWSSDVCSSDLLDGVKQFITNGSTAQVAIILAVTDPDAGTRAMSFFLVPTDTPGFIIGKVEDKLGQNISDTAQIILEQCIIPDDAVMGEPNMALPATMGLLSDGRISAAAQSVGIARAAFETARDYVKEREAFGNRLIDHQDRKSTRLNYSQ